jgi:trafficking protein particle complex subunit 6
LWLSTTFRRIVLVVVILPILQERELPHRTTRTTTFKRSLQPPPPPPPPPNLFKKKDRIQIMATDERTSFPFQVSDAAMEFLMTEVLRYVEMSTPPDGPSEEQAIFAKEQSAAKLERMGYSVGFRLCERLAQNRTFSGAAVATATAAAAAATAATAATAKDPAHAVAAAQLEAVKFLCKEVWMEVFRKQIDKLQTNHRGVFVLKDMELKWLTRLPSQDESARVTAIQLLAFPCGIVRGALSNLGIPAVVSCDFLSDGQNMAACSFNIKIK